MQNGKNIIALPWLLERSCVSPSSINERDAAVLAVPSSTDSGAAGAVSIPTESWDDWEVAVLSCGGNKHLGVVPRPCVSPSSYHYS